MQTKNTKQANKCDADIKQEKSSRIYFSETFVWTIYTRWLIYVQYLITKLHILKGVFLYVMRPLLPSIGSLQNLNLLHCLDKSPVSL